MRILAIADYMPYPLISGDRLRIYHLLRHLAKWHEVTLVSFLMEPDEAAGIQHMLEFCREVHAIDVPRRKKLARLPGLVRCTLAGIPFDFEFLQSAQLAGVIRQLASRNDYDIVQIEHSRMAPYVEALPRHSAAARFLTLHNVTAVQFDRMARIALTPARRMRARLNAQMVRRWEPHYARRFDGCIAVSDADRHQFLQANPQLRMHVVPNGVDTHAYQPLPPCPARPAVLLVGNMSYAPCADGALWFCNEILPHIQRLLGEIDVWIVGLSPPPQVMSLDGGCVHVTGRVPDVVPYYERIAISVVPLRAGSGTRLKILEAMALGRPVVSTRIGCEGLAVEDGRHLLMADEPEEFARKTVQLLTDASLYKRVLDEARRLVATTYDWDVIARQLLDIYGSALENERMSYGRSSGERHHLYA